MDKIVNLKNINKCNHTTNLNYVEMAVWKILGLSDFFKYMFWVSFFLWNLLNIFFLLNRTRSLLRKAFGIYVFKLTLCKLLFLYVFNILLFFHMVLLIAVDHVANKWTLIWQKDTCKMDGMGMTSLGVNSDLGVLRVRSIFQWFES